MPTLLIILRPHIMVMTVMTVMTAMMEMMERMGVMMNHTQMIHPQM
jgi:hypothetical protein